MKITEATRFFEDLKVHTQNKGELKIYQKFLRILKDLKNRDLSEEQLYSLETELGALGLKAQSQNSKKYFRKKLSQLTQYLLKELSLITEGYYTALGISLGVAFGAAFGSLSLSIFGSAVGMSMGVSMGMIIGLIIGATMDSEAKKQGRVLNTKLN